MNDLSSNIGLMRRELRDAHAVLSRLDYRKISAAFSRRPIGQNWGDVNSTVFQSIEFIGILVSAEGLEPSTP